MREMLSSSGPCPEAREIRALSLCLTFVAFALAIHLDCRSTSDEVEQVRLKLAGMLLASFWAGPLTIVAGFYAYPSWKLLQPFQGGGGFVVVQAVGWLLYGISLFAVAVACLNARQLATTMLPRGVYASLGSLGAAAQATLNFSIGLYVEAPRSSERLRSSSGGDEKKSTTGEIDSQQRKTKAPLTALSLMLSVAGYVMTAFSDEIFRGLVCSRVASSARCENLGVAAAGSLIWTGTASHGLASVLTHVVHGRVAHTGKHYRAFMPFEGGPRFVLLQALAWTLWGLVVDVLVAVSPRRIAKIPGGPSLLSLCLLVANVVLVVAIDLFSTPRRNRRRPSPPPGEEKEDAAKEESMVSDEEEKKIASKVFVGGPERVVATLFVVLSLLAFFVGLALQPVYRKRRSSAPPPAYAMATVLCHLAPPLAHFGGARTTPGYGLFMVGDGGPRFVVAQGCGWMLYSFSLLASVVLLVNGTNRSDALLRGAPPLAVLSSGILVVSVGLFDRSLSPHADVDPYAARLAQEDEAETQQHGRSLPTTVAVATTTTQKRRGVSSLKQQVSEVGDEARGPAWRIRCDVACLVPAQVSSTPMGQNKKERRRLRRSLLASKALAASLAARDALEDIANLRTSAKTPALRALLDAAEDALVSAKDQTAGDLSSSSDEDEDEDDLQRFIDESDSSPALDPVERPAAAAAPPLERRMSPRPRRPLSPLSPEDGVGPTKRLVLARDLDAAPSRQRLLDLLVDATSLFAAPLASLAGIALFAGADLFGPPLGDTDLVVPSSQGYVLSPVLAVCAFVATLASAPLQFSFERRFPAAAPGKRRRRFVALRLVALAAWSFAVLVSLAALLRYTACSGCALALSIGRRVSGVLSLRSPLGACGWGGLGVQLLVLVCAPPADSLQAAFGLIGRRRERRHHKAVANNLKNKHEEKKKDELLEFLHQRTKKAPFLSSGHEETTTPFLASAPEDAWRQVEAFLSFSDLSALSAAAKKPRWCNAYRRAARWRRLFAARNCGTREQPPRLGSAFPPVSRRQARLGEQFFEFLESVVDLARWFYESLDVALAGNQDAIDAHFDGHLNRIGDPQLRERAVRALRTGADRRRELRRRPIIRSRALPWKLACVLHERGAPLVRCASCGEVDLGDDREFLAPCASCGTASYHHRRCLEKDLDLGASSPAFFYATVDDDMLALEERHLHRPLCCAHCGSGLALEARPPRGPLELLAVLRKDRAAPFRVGRRCLQQWTLVLLGVTALARGNYSCRCLSPVMAWYLLQQTCLFHVFVTHRFSAVVARLWSTATRNAVGFYLKLYGYFILASAGILANFSPLPLLFSTTQKNDHAASLARRCVHDAIAVLSWANLIVYAIISSACLYLFVKTHYRLPTIRHHRP